MNDHIHTFARWAAASQAAMHDALSLLKPFFAAGRETDPATTFVLGQLSANCAMTSDSAVLLIAHGRLWDAEMLARSVLEGTFKFAFMCVRDDNERSDRVREYYYDLPDLSRMKRHDRASAILASPVDPNTDKWRPVQDLIIPDEELAELRRKFPRKSRRALEQKWNFIPLAQALAASGVPGGAAAPRMAYTYGISSHLLHQDGDGVSVVWEREGRPRSHRDAINLSHGAREISDLSFMAIYRLQTAYYLRQLDPAPIDELIEKHSELFDELKRRIRRLVFVRVPGILRT